ncbi:MAG TPA: autotransporter-associated beta strand repeat-containing protein [Chthoniobacterales bacterium]|jgi:autotransporter-associated beta strand protein|nr:autotransporter-associated beta strand repeat-containing protein [Chthoniobacterales bacterium]
MNTHCASLLSASRLGLLALICFGLHAAEAGSATWLLDPPTNKWNSAANWMPNTIPNGANDIATFSVSNQTSVSMTADATVNSVIFQPGASAFTITTNTDFTLTVSGAGIENDSGVTQTFVQLGTDNFTQGGIAFKGTASPGPMTTFMQMTGSNGYDGLAEFFDSSSAGQGLFLNQGLTQGGIGYMIFFFSSTAGEATIINEGANESGFQSAQGGLVTFFTDSSAGNATIENLGSNISATHGGGGEVHFFSDTSCGNAVLINHGGAGADRAGGVTTFFNESTADHATILCEAGEEEDAISAGVSFEGDSTAADATISVEGSNFADFGNGFAKFRERSTAANANIIVTGGTNAGPGGAVGFFDQASGGTAQFSLSGNGSISFDTSKLPELTVGSLNGSGLVNMGSKTLSIGATNLDSTFGSVIQDGLTGSNATLVKEGTGTLTLTGPNTYTGGTTIDAGILLANSTTGSTTGTGPVQVNAGTLGGSGIIAGAVTVGTNTRTAAFLAPSKGAKKPATLIIRSGLILNDDSTYTYKLDTRRLRADEVVANGVTIDGGAKFSFQPSGNNGLTTGQVFTVINNTAATPIAGTFHNLANGGIITVNGSKLQASYSGGDGNDLTLTVVP